MIWLADHKDWEEAYPHLLEYPDSTELRSLINVPTYVTGAPIGVMGIMCNKEVRPTPEDVSFVDIVAGLASLHLSKSMNKHALLEDRGAYLTKRQIIILEMMSQQMTNMQIAKELGYSESTIRHETSQVRTFLNWCHKRGLIDRLVALFKEGRALIKMRITGKSFKRTPFRGIKRRTDAQMPDRAIFAVFTGDVMDAACVSPRTFDRFGRIHSKAQNCSTTVLYQTLIYSPSVMAEFGPCQTETARVEIYGKALEKPVFFVGTAQFLKYIFQSEIKFQT